MISLKIIESLTTVYAVEQWIEIGKGIIEDSKKAMLTSTGYSISHYTYVIIQWETIYLPALNQQKEEILLWMRGKATQSTSPHGRMSPRLRRVVV